MSVRVSCKRWAFRNEHEESLIFTPQSSKLECRGVHIRVVVTTGTPSMSQPTAPPEAPSTAMSPQAAQLKAQLDSMGAIPFFEKCLTNSDAAGHGRVVLPKVCSPVGRIRLFINVKMYQRQDISISSGLEGPATNLYSYLISKTKSLIIADLINRGRRKQTSCHESHAQKRIVLR